ncbi:MAG: helix-turn-helix domain-containing protein [Pseudonocardiaceae bacterium]|nr:helix-turn-helix domain-containing protein [Pseudonocardiaceae bacterium]
MNADQRRLEPAEIGERVRKVRRRRGLSLEVAAGLAGISMGYLSMLERGERRFERRGLVEDLASALGCSPADLTGQPYLPPDSETAAGKRVVARIEQGLNDATLDDVPDMRPRDLSDLRELVESHARSRDGAQYSAAAQDADLVLVELQVHIATGTGPQRREAAELLVRAAYNAFVVATTYGYFHLAEQAARRAYDAAVLTEQAELLAFAMFARVPSIARAGGRDRAIRLLDRTLSEQRGLSAIHHDNTLGAEMLGLLHLMGAHLAARGRDTDAAHAHVDEATQLAARTGERNGLLQHFGPTNVQVWQVAIAAELDEGPTVAERTEREPIDIVRLDSRDRAAALHFDLARSYGQAHGSRDTHAVQHLEIADRFAPQRIRQDPLARDLIAALSHRSRRRSWELDSLRNRFGLG